MEEYHVVGPADKVTELIDKLKGRMGVKNRIVTDVWECPLPQRDVNISITTDVADFLYQYAEENDITVNMV